MWNPTWTEQKLSDRLPGFRAALEDGAAAAAVSRRGATRVLGGARRRRPLLLAAAALELRSRELHHQPSTLINFPDPGVGGGRSWCRKVIEKDVVLHCQWDP